MEYKKTSLLNGMTFEQLLARAWRQLEQRNLREGDRKILPPKKVRRGPRVLEKHAAQKPHVHSTAT